MVLLPWRDRPAPPDAATLKVARVLLATEGRPISDAAVAKAAEIAAKSRAPVKVLAIARVWGSAFGMPHPGLRPNKSEWQAQYDIVADAIKRLKRRQLEATGEVYASRQAANAVLRHAEAIGAGAIVMTADPEPHWLQRGLLWSQQPHIVARKAKLPVYLSG